MLLGSHLQVLTGHLLILKLGFKSIGFNVKCACLGWMYTWQRPGVAKPHRINRLQHQRFAPLYVFANSVCH